MASFPFISVKEATEVLQRGENSLGSSRFSKLERAKGGVAELRGMLFITLRIFAYILLGNVKKAIWNEKTKAKTEALGSNLRSGPESLHSLALCSDGVCLSESELLLVACFSPWSLEILILHYRCPRFPSRGRP